MALILAFAGSNSSTSINFKLVRYTSKLVDLDVNLVNMANHTFPMYSEDRENQLGFPDSITELKSSISEADGLIIAVNEHNGGVSAYFKNTLDWLSRVDRNYMENKKVFLMSTSPGKRGGVSALEYAKNVLPRVGAKIEATFILPNFHENFNEEQGIIDPELANLHKEALNQFKAEL